MLAIKVAGFYTGINTVEWYPRKTYMMMLYHTYRKRNIVRTMTRTTNAVARLTGRFDHHCDGTATMSAWQYNLRKGS